LQRLLGLAPDGGEDFGDLAVGHLPETGEDFAKIGVRIKAAATVAIVASWVFCAFRPCVRE